MNIEKTEDQEHYPNDAMPIASAFQKMAMVFRSEMKEQISNEKWFPKDFRLACVGVLKVLGYTSNASQKEISIILGIDPSETVALIDQLENAGFVIRTRDKNDRRKHILSLTRKGEIAKNKITVISDEVAKEILTPLNKKEIETFRKLLECVVQYNHMKIE
ncbi:MAG: winged helix-turn-helix transcriptional regulator [Acidimicrobiia bacterium]|nr:winged helix-turn-helix transcriptional regulator [Acidimicrobiia bacterium]